MNPECQYLSDERMPYCTIDKKLFIPRIFVFEEYCKTICLNKKHRLCHFYRTNDYAETVRAAGHGAFETSLGGG
jgi:hypothetical protein